MAIFIRLKLSLIVLMMCVFMSNNEIASAMGTNNPTLLKDLKVNSQKYIEYGGQSVGMVFYLDRTSVVIESNNESETVLAVKTVIYSNNGMLGNKFKDAAWYGDKPRRFAYNHKTKNIFEERYNYDKKQIEWVYLDPEMIGTYEGYKKGWEASISAAEITYYIAFHKWFYGYRVSKRPLDNL